MYRENDTIGPYTLRRKLGKGAFGVVWLADKRTAFGSFEYAIKMAARDDIDLNAVAEEVTTWKDAKGHPNVLPLIDADVYGEDFVIVSEFAPDGSLQGWLDAHGGRAPDTETAVKMTNGILDGLIHLHSKHIIHRDLKPDNILLRGTTPMLADFGLARMLKTTHSATIAGTVQYMSPEALDSKRMVQVDVWSVGVILYQMLTGRLPFPQKNNNEVMFAIIMREPAPLPASVPAGLREIVARALQKDTAQRQSTAQAMRDELRAFTEEQAEARRRAAQQTTQPDLQLQHLVAEEQIQSQSSEEQQQQGEVENTIHKIENEPKLDILFESSPPYRIDTPVDGTGVPPRMQIEINIAVKNLTDQTIYGVQVEIQELLMGQPNPNNLKLPLSSMFLLRQLNDAPPYKQEITLAPQEQTFLIVARKAATENGFTLCNAQNEAVTAVSCQQQGVDIVIVARGHNIPTLRKRLRVLPSRFGLGYIHFSLLPY